MESVIRLVALGMILLSVVELFLHNHPIAGSFLILLGFLL